MRRTFLALTMAGLVGCGSGRTGEAVSTTNKDTSTSSGEVAKATGHSLVRFVNALGTTAMSLTADDSLVAQSVETGTVTPYQTVRDNNVTFRVRAAGSDSVVGTNMEILMDGSRYTVVAMREADGNVKVRALKDELMPDSGKARLRVIHALPGVDELDVIAPPATEPLFDNLNFGNEGGYKDLTPGEVTVTMRNSTGGGILKREKVALAAGTSTTLVLTGTKGAAKTVSVIDRAEPKP